MKKHKMHYFIIYLLLPSADSSNSDCTLCTTMSWGTWGDCNRDCGGGFRKRYREVCCPKTVEYNTCVSQTCPLIPREEKEQEQSCNNQCYNGGQFNNETCHCQPGWIEPCCQSQCEEGFFGLDCKFKCECPADAKCDKENGACLRAQFLTETKPKDIGLPTRTYIIISVAAGGFVLVQVCIVTVLVMVKRKKRREDDEKHTLQLEKFWPADIPESHYEEIPCSAKGKKPLKKGSFRKSSRKGSKKLKEQTSDDSAAIYQGLGGANYDDGYRTLTIRKGEPLSNQVYMTPEPLEDTSAQDPMNVISSIASPGYLSMTEQGRQICNENQYVSMYNDIQSTLNSEEN